MESKNSFEFYNSQLQKDPDLHKKPAAQDQVVFTWKNVYDKQKNKKDLQADANIDVAAISASLSSTLNQSRSPSVVSWFGIKIQYSEQDINTAKAKYMKHYAKTKSHNLLLSKYSEFMADKFGRLLSNLGVSQGELEAIRHKVTSQCVDENLAMRDENLYNRELTEITGGNSRKVRGALKVMDEIHEQLVTQAKKLDIEGEYTDVRLIQVRKEKCMEILESFKEERTKLQYFLDFA